MTALPIRRLFADEHDMMDFPASWEYLGEGASRRTWMLPSGNVIKIPLNTCSEDDNIREASIWANRHNLRSHFENDSFYPKRELDWWCMRYDSWKFARCRLIPNTSILVMEFITPYYDAGIKYRDLPVWAKDCDSAQVGLNKAGQLVAYDYAE